MSEQAVADFVNLRPGLHAWDVGHGLGEDPYEVYYVLRKLERRGTLTVKDRRWFPVHEPRSGVLWGWETEIDDRTCDRCRELDGETFTEEQLIDKFPYLRKVGTYVWRPMLHPNCRCRLIRLVAIR